MTYKYLILAIENHVTRLWIFSEKNIINESKVNINTYETSELNYSIFENSPEDILKSYCGNLNIDNLEQIQINTQKCEICNMDRNIIVVIANLNIIIVKNILCMIIIICIFSNDNLPNFSEEKI